jgi:HK97 family phage major capsid protein
MRTITNSPSDGGDLSAEQAEKFNSLKTQLESVEKQLERQRLIDEAERRMAGGESLNRDDHFTRACQDFSLQRAIAAQIDPRAVDCAREIEISSELARRSGRKPRGMFVPLESLVEKRVQTIAQPGTGLNLVQTDVLAEQFIDALRPASVVARLGGRLITGLRDNIALPKLAGSPASEWVAEGAPLTPADHILAQVLGEPHHCGLVTTYSRRMLLQTNPSIESIIRSDYTASLGAAVDAAALVGLGGVSAVPEGIINNSDVNAVATIGTVQYGDLTSAVALVESSNVPMQSLGWAANSWCRTTLQQTPKLAIDTTGTSGWCMGEGNTLLSFPFLTTSQLPGDPTAQPAVDGDMIFGAWNQVIVAFWGDAGADILVNPYESNAYLAGNVLVRAFIDSDVLVRHGQAFTYLSGITLIGPPA